MQQIHIPGIKHHILKMEDELDDVNTNPIESKQLDKSAEAPSFQNIPSLLKWRANTLKKVEKIYLMTTNSSIFYDQNGFKEVNDQKLMIREKY